MAKTRRSNDRGGIVTPSTKPYGLPPDVEAEAHGPAALTVSELRSLADDRSIELPARATKADIVAALEENEPDEDGERDGAEEGDDE